MAPVTFELATRSNPDGVVRWNDRRIGVLLLPTAEIKRWQCGLEPIAASRCGQSLSSGASQLWA